MRKSPFDSSAGVTPPSPRCSSTPRSTTRSRSTSTRPTHHDTYRAASGAGGQHINKTDSAVRLTHPRPASWCSRPGQPQPAQQPRPGYSACAQTLRLRDAQAHGAVTRGHQDRRRLGHQIRSYINRQQPHQGPAHQRRDLGDAEVLDGDLDAFTEASLQARRNSTPNLRTETDP